MVAKAISKAGKIPAVFSLLDHSTIGSRRISALYRTYSSSMNNLDTFLLSL